MTKVEQLRKRLVKLQEQILRVEVDEITGSTPMLVLANGSTSDDFPLVTCPNCGDETQFTEAQLDNDGNRWTYYQGFCDACRTDFRIGEVPDKCALCHEPFVCDPREDVNEFYHHWCEKDRRCYCTPCFMQLFFDSYIDLSSDNPEVRDEEHCPSTVMPYSRLYTHIGHSVSPYHSRLIAKGYEEVARAKEWDEIKQLCKHIVEEGHRYLILSVSNKGEDGYIIFRTGAEDGDRHVRRQGNY
jgi:hypothetical protein